MELIAFTAVAAALYLGSNFVLDRIERSLGRRLEHRSLIFFFMLLSSAIGTFALIRYLLAP